MGRAARFPKSLCRSRKETAAIKNNHAPRPAGGYSPAEALCAGGTRFISWEPWYGAGRSAWEPDRKFCWGFPVSTEI